MERSNLSAQSILERRKKEEIKFKSCGRFTGFESYDWYHKLNSLLENQQFPLYGKTELNYVKPDNISGACHSINGNIFSFIVSEKNSGFNLFRYDINLNSVQQATTQSLNLSVSPSHFGKRNGDIIQLEGVAVENSCQRKVEYDYNFIQNTIKIKQNCLNCPGQDAVCNNLE